MIEETATVFAVEGETAWVTADRRSTCGSCAARSGCGTSRLADYFARRQLRLPIVNSLGARAGDEIVMGIEESALVTGSIRMYLVPLITMMAGAAVGEFMTGQVGAAGESGTLLGAAIGLFAGFGWTRMSTARRRGVTPRMLRII